MFKASARLAQRLLTRAFPANGRHRAVLSPAPEQPRVPPLCGEAIGIVRPYLVAHERRQRAEAVR